MESANGVRTPIGDDCNADDDNDSDFLPASGASGEPSLNSFESLVGILLWIARCTRPEIYFEVHTATRQTNKPTVKDWKTATRNTSYLKGSKSLKLDFAADKVDRKLVSGCVLTMDGAVVLCHARNSQVCR